MATFLFELVSPEKISFSGNAESVTLPAEEGELMILPGHAPLIATLKTGLLIISLQDHKKIRFLITGGFLDIGEERMAVLAENAYDETNWSAELFDRELEKCQTALETIEVFEERVLMEENINTLKQLRASVL